MPDVSTYWMQPDRPRATQHEKESVSCVCVAAWEVKTGHIPWKVLNFFFADWVHFKIEMYRSFTRPIFFGGGSTYSSMTFHTKLWTHNFASISILRCAECIINYNHVQSYFILCQCNAQHSVVPTWMHHIMRVVMHSHRHSCRSMVHTQMEWTKRKNRKLKINGNHSCRQSSGELRRSPFAGSFGRLSSAFFMPKRRLKTEYGTRSMKDAHAT